jgi:hypothetical protein
LDGRLLVCNHLWDAGWSSRPTEAAPSGDRKMVARPTSPEVPACPKGSSAPYLGERGWYANAIWVGDPTVWMGDTLISVTHGRGMYRIDLSGV